MSDTWPGWARRQLLDAVTIATGAGGARLLAADLYERWYAGAVPSEFPRGTRPLVGAYRAAHAGVGTTIVDGLPVLDRHDRIGRDGWWRTWNTGWRPGLADPRVLLSPRADSVADVVAALTAALRDVPYALACPTDPARLTASGAVVLYLPRMGLLAPDLVESLAPWLRADSPPLCLPVAPGVAVAQYPDNGMTFGEHRCHLVALALRAAATDERAALREIATVFRAHGVDPAAPYRTARA